jgi:hypothetical protein
MTDERVHAAKSRGGRLSQERQIARTARIAGGVAIVAGISFMVAGRAAYGLAFLGLGTLNLVFLGRRTEATPRDVASYLRLLSLVAAVGAVAAIALGILGFAGVIGQRPLAMGLVGLMTALLGALTSVLFVRAARRSRPPL